MTQHDSHPPFDVLADQVEGLLPAAESVAVNAHVASCPDCQDRRASLESVRATLRAESATTIPIPTDVADRLDAVILAAAAERVAAGEQNRVVVPIEGRAAARRRARAGRFLLAGAAATAVILGIGYALNLPQNGDSDMSAKSGGAEGGNADSVREPGAESPGTFGPASQGNKALAVRQAERLATATAVKSYDRLHPGTISCLGAVVPGFSASWATRFTTFGGAASWLTISPDDRHLWVASCAPKPRLLFDSDL